MATILIRFDQPTQFTVVVDGDVRAHIVKEGPEWRLRRLDRKDASNYRGIDVTSDLFQHEVLVPRIERHLRDA
jgi:hypothetical protein